MKLTRRQVLLSSAAATGSAVLASCQTPGSHAPLQKSAGTSSIDRRAVVSRHNPHVQKLDPFSALTLGNGSFAFTADITGLQTFLDPYDKEFPLCTTATWAWHTSPHGPDIDPAAYKYKLYDSHGRQVPYDTEQKSPTAVWMRENPHRMHLGRIGLFLIKPNGVAAIPSDLTAIDQTLDLWTGSNESRFEFLGKPVRVQTCVHPKLDLLAVRIDSSLLQSRRVAARLDFPYPTSAVNMTKWDLGQNNVTTLTLRETSAGFSRKVDDDRYYAEIVWQHGAFENDGDNGYVLCSDSDNLTFVIAFASDHSTSPIPTFDETLQASADHWQNFWTQGAIIDLSQSTDPRAHELERRTILSAYNTALHCAGPMPPSETGLLFNSWYGKSHLEMHWWHGVHFAAWNRLPLFERSLDFYQRIFPVAKEIATRQGYAGVRWPKMVGPDGLDSPSSVGPLLIWQQPHPIYYAELCYHRNPSPKTLTRWKNIVLATADFMASYAFLDNDRYVLGPPLKTVSENTDQLHTMNPTFELAYWRFGLRTAQLWRKRLGLAPDLRYADVLARLAPLPQDQGRYLFQEGTTDTYSEWNWEHPAILGALGMQPGDGVDPILMNNSLHKIMEVWQWDRAWGWDFGMTALCAARLGERDIAFNALLIDSVKNRYHPNGHVYQRPNLTAYLPANGALLAAIALLAVGTVDNPRPNTTTRNSTWSLRSEGLRPLL